MNYPKVNYPKQIMKRSELVKMGFPETFLDKAFNDKNQTFACKNNPLASNSPIIFDTEGFEKWRLNQVKTSKQGVAS